MLSKTTSAATLAALLSAIARVQALSVSFYGGAMCTGEPEGVVTDAVAGTCYQVPIDSDSAVLNVTDGNYDQTVSFYSDTKCEGTKEGSGNNGCIDFSSLGGDVQSYQIDQSPEKAKKVRRDDSNWWDAQAEQHRNILGISAENATGSLAPHWDPYSMVGAGYGHGNVSENWGKTWKWQQVALGITIGIPIEDWDDEIHTLNEDFIPFHQHEYEMALAKRGGDLAKRWDYSDCRALLDCGLAIANGATVNIGNGWAQAVAAAYKLKTVGSTFYDFVHLHPFSVGLATAAGSTVTGYALGYSKGGATAQDNQQLGDCANDTTQQQAFIQSLATVAMASNDNSAEVNITLPDGNILQISASVYPANNYPGKDKTCDADEGQSYSGTVGSKA